MNLLGRLATVARQPSLAPEYVKWLCKSFLGNPTRELRGVKIGGFVNFSEYHSTALCVSDDEFAFWRRYPFPEKGAFLDVGANLGIISLMLAKRYPARRIVAFEPMPSTVDALEENIRRNSASVAALPVAVSNVNGTAELGENESRARASLAVDPGSKTHAVQCRRLDELATELGIERIALLKIDVEGCEMEVLQGAPLDKTDVVYFEVVPRLCEQRGIDPRAPASLLRDHGFALHRVGPNGLIGAVPEDVMRATIENWVAIRINSLGARASR